MAELVLAVNAGSSTVKVSAFDAGTLERRQRMTVPVATPNDAVEAVLGAMGQRTEVRAVGHRVVHGGERFVRATLVSDEVFGGLAELAPLDPEHMPAILAVIRAMRERLPRATHVACFDTAFFYAMPSVAKRLAVPRRFGMRRFGFHGLSYTYLMTMLPAHAVRGRVVLAHLGAGASLAAVMNGAAIDTTMGYTPTAGVPMATRTGDLDPGVMLAWLRSGMDVAAIDELVNKKSGLLGVSETTGDMRELLERERADDRAREAIELFCYETKKAIGALAAAMGGMSTLVFSGGIGEHACAVRARIAEGLFHLGVELDERRNLDSAPIISTDASACTVRVIPTDEEIVIARETVALARTP